MWNAWRFESWFPLVRDRAAQFKFPSPVQCALDAGVPPRGSHAVCDGGGELRDCCTGPQSSARRTPSVQPVLVEWTNGVTSEPELVCHPSPNCSSPCSQSRWVCQWHPRGSPAGEVCMGSDVSSLFPKAVLLSSTPGWLVTSSCWLSLSYVSWAFGVFVLVGASCP